MLEIAKIVELAKEHATPMYLFDLDELQSRVQAMKEILGEDIRLCYAMKANPFLVDSMKQAVHKFEVCSPGEFAICEREQVAMADIVLSGVNKEKADILHVMKDCGGVGVYTIESRTQLELLQACAKETNLTIRALIRVTSGNQFGMDQKTIEELIENRQNYPFLKIRGIHYFSGTQKRSVGKIQKELEKLDVFLTELKQKYDFEPASFCGEKYITSFIKSSGVMSRK